MKSAGICSLVGIAALLSLRLATAQGRPSPPVSQAVCSRSASDPIDHATMDHAAHPAAIKECALHPAQALPGLPGQAAYGAIGEIVRILDADSATDWSRVNIEALRRHLIDMDDVTLHARATQRAIAGGVVIDARGTGATAGAIRRMVANHSRMLATSAALRSSITEIPGGVRWAVTAGDIRDVNVVARIRGLGFAGLLTVGEHHAAHHLALARGESDPHGH